MMLQASTAFGRSGLVLLTAVACLVGTPVGAQVTQVAVSKPAATEVGSAWLGLTPAQRDALAPLRSEWSGLDTERKQKWLEVAARFPSMSADERARVQVRMADWVRMSPAERGRARLQFQEARQLSPVDRQARWDAYKALPPAERTALAAKAVPSAGSNATASRLEQGIAASGAKRNVVTSSSAAGMAAAIAPTVVQAKPGATTTLMSKPATPPAHHQPGLPKIAATKGFVDPSTLLPKRGPQGAAVAVAPVASSPNARLP